MDKQPNVVREYCTRHAYGSFIEGPYGIQCVACLKEADELPQDYEPCGTCGYDHAYEPTEAQNAHENAERSRLGLPLAPPWKL